MDTLTGGDIICTLKQLSSTDKSIEDTQTQNTEATEYTTNAMTHGTRFSAIYIYVLFAAESSFFKGNIELALEVSAALGTVAGGSGCPAKESVKNIPKAAKAKSLKAPGKETVGTIMSIKVIGSPLVSV